MFSVNSVHNSIEEMKEMTIMARLAEAQAESVTSWPLPDQL